MKFLATFYTHFAAQSFHRNLASHAATGRMMPVPRRLSASCGTCVMFEIPNPDFMPLLVEDTEEVFRVEEGEYIRVYAHED